MEIISTLINNNGSGSTAQQSAEEIIPLLCDRLSNSRLASDKRAAILTLKGFSRDYRELVVASGLRGLISTLKGYTVDSEIMKPLLETLLILFIRGESDDDMTRGWISQQSRVKNGKYPSPLLMKEADQQTDQFSFWIADELTQDQEIISSIVSLLENDSFHIRIYTLQLLESLVAVRPKKTKEMLLNSTLGVPLLVEILNDIHDPVRNEAILLLLAIANDNFNIQKLIAFDSTFDKLFDIIHEEGDIRGSIVVQDCLTLLSNLLRYNISNQKLFLETNCLPKLAFLLNEPLNQEEEIIWNDQRLQNIIMCLDIVKLFIIEDNESTKSYQDLFFKSEIFFHILRLSFSSKLPNSLRTTALLTVSNLIYDNEKIQNQFNEIDVPYIDPSLPTPLQEINHENNIPVVNALLNWSLLLNSVHSFDIRVAAGKVLSSYFKGNAKVRNEFISSQIENFLSNHKEFATPVAQRANILHVLLDYDPELKLNPYKVWFASYILIDMFNDVTEEESSLKELIKNITIGNAEEDEEVLTPIQSIGSLLVTTLYNSDIRISIGYLTLLIVWLHEDCAAVDDFLTDSSNFNALLTFLTSSNSGNDLVQGLVTILIGVIFEFSRSQSPIPRVDIHSMILKRLGKDNYSFRILKFKENKFFANFEQDSIFNPTKDETGLPEVFLEPVVVSLVKENFYRFKNVLNQDPNVESCGKLSFEKYEELRGGFLDVSKKFEELQLSSKEQKLKLNENLVSLEENYSKLNNEFNTTKSKLSNLEKDHNELTENFKSVSTELQNLNKSHQDLSTMSNKKDTDFHLISEKLKSKEKEITQLKSELDSVSEQKKKAEDGINKMSRELFTLSKEKDSLTYQVSKLEKEIKNNTDTITKLEQNLKNKTERVESMSVDLNKLTSDMKAITTEKTNIEKDLSQLKNSDEKNKAIITQLSEKLRSLANTYNAISTEKTDLQTKLIDSEKNYEYQLNSAKGELQKMKESADGLCNLNTLLKAENEKISKELEKSKLQHSENSLSLQKDLSATKENLKKSQTELDSSKSLCVKYEGQLKDLMISLSSTKDDLSVLKSEHDKQIKELNEANTSIVEKLEGDIAQLTTANKESITLLESQIQDLSTLKLDSDKTLQEKVAKIKSFEFDMKCKVDEIHELTVVLETSEKTIANLMKEKDTAENTVSELKVEIEDFISSKKVLQNEIEDLKETFKVTESDLKKKVDTFSKQVESSQDIKSSLESTIKELEEKYQAKTEEYDAVVEELQTSKNKLSEFVDSLKDAEALHSNVEKSLKISKVELENLKKDNSQLNEKLESSIEEVRSKQKTINSLTTSLEEEKKKNNENIAKFDKEILSLKESMSKKSDEFEKERILLTENSSSSTKEYSERVHQLEKEIESLEDSNNSKLSAFDTEIRGLKDQVSDLSLEKERLLDDLKDKEMKLKDVKNSVSISEKEHAISKKQLEDSKIIIASEVDSLKNLLMEKETKLNSLDSDLKNKVNQLSEFEKKNADLKTEYESLISQLNSKTDKISLLSSEVQDQKNEIEKLKTIEIELKQLNTSVSEEKNKSQTDSDLEIKRLSDELKVYEQSFNNLKIEMSQLGNQAEISKKELISMKSTLKNTTENYESELLEISKSKKALELELTNGNKTKENLIAQLEKQNKELSTKLEQLENSSMLQITKLEKSNEELQTNVNKSTAAATELLELKDKLQKLESNTIQQSQDFSKITEENSKLLNELHSLKNQLAQSQEITLENERLSKELSDLKSKQQSTITTKSEDMVPRSELDDLMLVLGDLEERKEEYKRKLKVLGGDVSSDEESDDDDDDE